MKMTKMTALLLAAAMALTACGSTAAVSSEAAASATAAPAAADTAVTYPLTVTDQLGREVTIETEPKTLASGYYISTSLLIALGVQDELVGVEAKADKRTIYSLSAPELQSLPSIGTAKEFDLEGCAALTPDLVIVPAKLKDSIPQMEELGLTVLAVKPEDQDKLYGAIDLLAQATNTIARGEALKSAIEDNLLSLHEAIGDAEAPTVYMAGNSSVLQTAGPAMYQNYMIENAGGLNAAASVEDTYWAEVSYEQVLDWDPDYIILASDADYDVDSVLNAAALAACAAVWGRVPIEAMRQVGSTFTGVEHRIEPVRTLDGVTYYNDSIASSPTRTIAGLRSFDQKIILIAGGYDKKIPYEPLAPEVLAHVKTLVLMGATGPRIEKAVRECDGFAGSGLTILHADSMQHAVELARGAAKPGDVVSLSPASASFDLYPNFEVRGRDYKNIVKNLK